MTPRAPAGRRRGPRVASGRFPWLLVLPALIGFAFLVLPFLGLLIRAPWPTLGTRLLMPEVRDALGLSLVTATIATGIALVLGVPLAWLLARTDFPGRRIVRALVTVPLVIPPVVGGVALLLVFGRNGVIGQYVHAWTGYSLPFTSAAVVVAQVFVAMPFLVISVEGAVRGADRRYEEAAATLGATRSTIFRRVTLPMAAPGVLAGAVLCWSRALGEFGATIMFAGNFPGRTQTMPLAVYLAMQQSPEAAIVLSLVLLFVSLAILVGLRDRWAGVA
ncbi:molybdate transport system permease protein [Spinactinospora alkalitolerans]|uniref:Molybdenum transport system permease n=1 Tax=Spinactinospora alkalitolerans TaxID=687207 RepID=A0A852TMW8_9ACTN|nr:ABC transporter permease [Spinactinospora alkalitolerans]NYE45278.1 molybdate transport system permease protein [Spinactinospora alkalitolerans]